MQLKPLSPLFASVLCALSAHAEPQAPTNLSDASPELLQEVVITATKTAKVVSEAPASVSVVTAKEIENKNVQRIDDALSGVPGVFIRAQGGGQPSNWQNQITLRGIPGYYRTGVLVDGVSINNAFSGGVNMSLIPASDIKQIEVVPGPFSSLYGGAGMAGVVNIITKSPTRRETSAQLETGSNGFRSLEASYRDKLDAAYGISVNAGHKQSDGYVDTYVQKNPTATPSTGSTVSGWQQTATSTGGSSYIVGDKGRAGWKQDRVGGKLFWDMGDDSRLVLDATYLTSKTLDGNGNNYLVNGSSQVGSGPVVINGKQVTINATDFLATTNGEDLTRISASYETVLTDSYKLNANLSYQANKYWYTSITGNTSNVNGAGSLSDIPNNMLNGDMQIGMPMGEQQYLIAGVSMNRSTLRKKVYALNSWRDIASKGAPGDWADGNFNSVAAYLQNEIVLSDKVTAFGGVRYDRVSNDGVIFIKNAQTNYAPRTATAVSPKVALVYKAAEKTVIKGAIGNAFRSPNLSDMYSTFGTTTIYWSNPDLKPEKVTTAELSGEHEFATRTLLRATVYQSDFTDLIYSTTSGVDRTKLNAGKAQAQGLDVEVRQAFGSDLSAFVNATAVNTTIKENSVRPTSVGKQIPLQAQKLANIGIDGRMGEWSGALIGSYTGKMYSTDDNSDTTSRHDQQRLWFLRRDLRHQSETGLSLRQQTDSQLVRQQSVRQTVFPRVFDRHRSQPVPGPELSRLMKTTMRTFTRTDA